MISLGLSASNQAKFEATLIQGYNLKIVVQILDLNHKYIADISGMLIDGQVNNSYSYQQSSTLENTTYAASLTLLDPDELVGFDTASPSDNALYADRMIRILYCVWVDTTPTVPAVSHAGTGLYSDFYSDIYHAGPSVSSSITPTGFWVDVPIFCGPVSKVARDDALLAVECLGKESLVSLPAVAWTTKTYKKGSLGVTAIKDVLTKAGETKFDIPNYTYKLGRDHVLGQESETWTFAKALQGTTRQLFYDGRGVCRLRDKPTRSCWVFNEANLLSVPKLDYNHADIRNGVLVKGATPTGKPQLTQNRFLPNTDASNPTALGRTNAPRRLVEVVEDSTLTTQTAVNTAADKLLESVKTSVVGFDFDSLPIPHLEIGDIFHLSTRDASLDIRLMQRSISLRAGAQANGALRKLSANVARLRKK